MKKIVDNAGKYFRHFGIVMLLAIVLTSFTRTGNEKYNCKTKSNPAQQDDDGWVMLFDGKTTNGWRGTMGKPFPVDGWKIENGVLTALEGEPGDNIVTEKMYSDFDLRLEFKIQPKANSGVKYFVLEGGYRKGSTLGLEYQIVDDSRIQGDPTGDSKKLASLYAIYASGPTHPNPPGEWNEIRIYAKGKYVEHWLNGEKVLSFTRGTKDFRERVAQSKFKDCKKFGEAKKGLIMLQDHSDEVSYRNVRIKEL